MSMFDRTLVILSTAALITALGPRDSARAQIPDKFENLKVLPKDISKRELVSIMRSFSGALGQRCSFCHVGEAESSLDTYDFKSDEKQEKITARAMMKMVSAINGDLIPTAKIDDPTRVRCVTCHRGLENPETLDQVLLATAQKDGVQAAIDRYRELRDKYYGSGSYDFDTGTLATVAETLAEKDLDGALAIASLNVEYNPEDAYAYLMLGQMQMTKGDKTAATASVERALAIDPDNKWAKRVLERIKASE